MTLVLANARIIDPSQSIDRLGDVVISDGKVADIADAGRGDGETVRDCSGLTITPGLIDIHVHLREPGFEYKEDIESGTKAAAAGGFTAVCCMPNTNPAIDNAAVIRQILERAAAVGSARVYPIGALTRSMAGDQLSEIAELKAAGAVAISDDAFPIQNAETMRRGMEYCAQFGMVLMTHNEDQNLTRGGAMNEGKISAMLGIPGIPRVAEDIAAARNILLSELTGCRLHLLHMSTGRSVDILRKAKARGIPVTGETAPHYWALNDSACEGYNTNAKMNPPIRTTEDGIQLIEGLCDGTIDCIATDHAPHAVYEKEREFDQAPFGILGLETSFAVSYTTLVRTGRLTLPELIDKMSTSPAKILRMPGGTLRVGAPADISAFNLDDEWVYNPAAGHSKSQNSPFGGWRLWGKPTFTIVAGRIIEPEELH
jgi:dihydroorotase